jgi:hypothetical protein
MLLNLRYSNLDTSKNRLKVPGKLKNMLERIGVDQLEWSWRNEEVFLGVKEEMNIYVNIYGCSCQ